MKCMVCGRESMTTAIGAYRLDVGLDEKATLENIPISRCPDCGDEEACIPRMDDLFAALGQAVAMKPGRLTTKEVAFLRNRLGMNNEAFAQYMGVGVEQVRRWQRENDSPITMTAERLLRATVLGRVDKETIGQLGAIDERKPLRSAMRSVNDHWERAA